jgi:hypothetical protein
MTLCQLVKAIDDFKRLRTIANKLIRELQRKLPTHSLFETYQKRLLVLPTGISTTTQR